MIIIKNTQRSIPVNLANINRWTHRMLHKAGYADYDLGIWLTTNATIRRYNKTYRGKDKPTDVLSFPYHTTLKPGQEIVIRNPEDKNLGDLIIAIAYAKKDASMTWNRPFDQHLKALIAHGIAHLLGYDHQTDKEWAAMRAVEKQLLA